MPYCDRCKKFRDERVCPECHKLLDSGDGISLDRSSRTEVNVTTVPPLAPQPERVDCPKCGQRPVRAESFDCVKCGKKNLCLRHFDDEYECCRDCAAHARAAAVALAAPQPARPADKLLTPARLALLVGSGLVILLTGVLIALMRPPVTQRAASATRVVTAAPSAAAAHFVAAVQATATPPPPTARVIKETVVVEKTVLVEKPVEKTVESTVVVEKPVPQTVVVEKQVKQTVVVEKPVKQTVVVEKPVQQTVVVEKPVKQTVVVEKPVQQTVVVEKPVKQTVVVEKPMQQTVVVERTVVVEKPVQQTVIVPVDRVVVVTAEPTRSPVFFDDFETKRNWKAYSDKNGSARYADGGYVLVAKPSVGVWHDVLPGRTFGEGVIEVDAFPLTTERTGVGISLGWKAGNTDVLFGVVPGGECVLRSYAHGKYTDHSYTFTNCPTLVEGQKYRLRVEVAGKRIKGYVDGKWLADGEFPDYTPGGVGVAVFNQGPEGYTETDPDTSARFDNFGIWK